MFVCPHTGCGKAYRDSRALGGHASKVHAGMSQTYKDKIKVRKERTGLRKALKIAQKLFGQVSSLDPRKERFRITQLRNVVFKVMKLDREPDKVREPENDWYMEFGREVLEGKYGVSEPYVHLFDKIATYASDRKQD